MSILRTIEAKHRELQAEQQKLVLYAKVAAAAAQAKAALEQKQQMTNAVESIVAKLTAAQQTQLELMKAAGR
ncbi:hypothetical protein D3C72_1495790 [compost metagenome]